MFYFRPEKGQHRHVEPFVYGTFRQRYGRTVSLMTCIEGQKNAKNSDYQASSLRRTMISRGRSNVNAAFERNVSNKVTLMPGATANG